jgi:hypothetical protein
MYNSLYPRICKLIYCIFTPLLLYVVILDPKQPTEETHDLPEVCLLNDDHPAENEIKEEERVDGQERSVFLNLGTTQKVHRG